jgi:DNA-directed RNA polymerase specialized sigma24 family protein
LHNLAAVSPLSVRRHRAERLLRTEFDALRGRVLTAVRGRLRASAVSLDEGDLEACYATAWQGLYAVVLDGQEIANPTGWLVLVTYRRAIEEHRARARARCAGELQLDGGSTERDQAGLQAGVASAVGCEREFADELDARTRLRHLFEGLRGRLDGREREAATLCYLQGLSRSEAAARMGVSEARMRKLMEGRGPGRPGVAAKVGALVGTIRDGDWCDEQGSLMRALAFGILDPDGERYRLALAHHSQCPACRAYVVSLRGLAVVLPPAFLPWGIAAATGAGLQAGRSLGGAVSASGVSGAAGASGAAGGTWLLGGGALGAKLAVGCLLALGVGAGCVALQGSLPGPASSHSHGHAAGVRATASSSLRAPGSASLVGSAGGAARAWPGGVRSSGPSTPLTARAKATREFGPEQALASAGAGATRAPAGGIPGGQPRARASSAGSAASAVPAPAGGGPASTAPTSSTNANANAAAREFSPG